MYQVAAAMRALETAITQHPSAEGWSSLVADRVDSLRRAYICDLQQSQRGLDDRVDTTWDATPWLAGRAAMLRREQSSLVEELDRLRDGCATSLEPDALRRQVVATLTRLARCRQREADLFYESVDLDLGGEQ
ncbi:MAG: hypothetical protein M3P83_05240 [Actinomycetota bacterium]|nr:hypothetical protein [Actinomycetota bacterium]